MNNTKQILETPILNKSSPSTNFVSTDHTLENKTEDDKVKLEPTSILNLELTILQKRMLIPNV